MRGETSGVNHVGVPSEQSKVFPLNRARCSLLSFAHTLSKDISNDLLFVEQRPGANSVGQFRRTTGPCFEDSLGAGVFRALSALPATRSAEPLDETLNICVASRRVACGWRHPLCIACLAPSCPGSDSFVSGESNVGPTLNHVLFCSCPYFPH